MAAHLRAIGRPRCANLGCDRYATQQLFNTWNAPLSCYCDRHAKAALRAFQREVGEVPEQGGAR